MEQMTEIKAALAELRTAAGRMGDLDKLAADLAEERKARADLEERLSKTETRLNRPGVPGGLDTAPRWGEFKSLMRGELKSMTGASGPDGGFAIPSQFDNLLVRLQREVSPVRQIARVVQAQTRDFYQLVSTGGTATGWTQEGQTRTATATGDLARIHPPSGELYAYPSTTNELIDDAAFDVEAFLREEVAVSMGAAEGAAFVSGDGLNKPRGFLTYDLAETADDTRPFGTLQTIDSGSATDVTADGLVSLVYACKAQHRARGAFAMNAATIGAVRKLKDLEGRYLWADALTAGSPPLLLGYPVVEVPDMPDVTGDAYPVAFGDWMAFYTLVDIGPMRMIVDRITAPGFTKLYMAKRVGGSVTNSQAVKLLKIST